VIVTAFGETGIWLPTGGLACCRNACAKAGDAMPSITGSTMVRPWGAMRIIAPI